MPFDQVLTYIPVAAVVVGLLLVLWSERERIQALLARERVPAPTETGLTPADRFAKFYALRNWCEQAGAAEAVKSLDGVVLPAIVQGGKPS